MSRPPVDAPRHRGTASRSVHAWLSAGVAAVSLLVVAASGSAQAQADETAAPLPDTSWTRGEPLLSEDFQGPLTASGGVRLWTSRGVQASSGGGRLALTGLGPGSSFSVAAPAVSSRDTAVSTSVTASPAGGAFYAGVSARLQPTGSRYAATATVRPGGAVVLTTERVDSSGTSVLARTTTTTSAADAVGAPLHVELRVAGASPTTVQARVWPEGAQVPAWQASGSDSGTAEISQAGGVAVAGYLSRSASSAQVALDGVSAWPLEPSAPGGGAAPAPAGTAAAPDATGGAAADPPTAATPTAATPTGGPGPDASSTGSPTLESLVTSSASPSSSASSSPSASPSASSSSSPSASPSASSSSSPSASPSASSSPSSSAAALPPRTSGAGFQHPGIVVSSDRLVFVRAQVAAGREPWTSALARARGSFYAKASWVPQPVPQVQCGAYNNPNIGCTAETDDAQAAYTNALLFSLTGEQRYADKAVQILDAWSGVLQGHSFDTSLYKNGRLQAAWAGQTFTKAAELVRYSRAGWAPDRVARFEQMLRTAFLPMVRDGWTGGQANWQLSMAEATMDIGVFLDDRAVFDDGVGDWRAQVVSAFYLTSDGPQPIPPLGTYVKASYVPTYWYKPSRFVDGLGQETCRDLGHTAMGLAAALNAAETAQIQGLDLFEEQRPRLVAAMELTATYLADPSAPGWVCPDPPKAGGTAGALTFEIGLRHYGVDDGLSLPRTTAWVQRNRPSTTGIFMNWETLTHGS